MNHTQAVSPTPRASATKASSSIQEEVDAIFSESQEEERPDRKDAVSVRSRIPSRYSSIIPFKYFNRSQSATCDAVLSTDDNIVVSAPTVVPPSPPHA